MESGARSTRFIWLVALAGCASNPGSSVSPQPGHGDTAADGIVCGDRATQLALGDHHACVLLTSGRVACWGDNRMGQLATAARPHSFIPSLVPGLSDVVEIRASGAATCVRHRTGAVACWGANTYGEADPNAAHPRLAGPFPEGAYCEIGEPPSFSPGHAVHAPQEIESLAGARGLSMGSQHGCAWFDDGRVTCWGDASRGQLGPEAPRDAYQRTAVSGIPPVVEVTSAGTYSCGRTAAGDVWCWGDNGLGQPGAPAPDPAPRKVPDVTGAVALELEGFRACARLARGEVVCWGDSGACVDTTLALPPARVAELDSSRQIARAWGGCFSCTLRINHELECEASPYTQKAISMIGVTSVEAGSDHACAIRVDGTVWCFGTNVRGELGRRTADERGPDPAPVQWPPASVSHPCEEGEAPP